MNRHIIIDRLVAQTRRSSWDGTFFSLTKSKVRPSRTISTLSLSMCLKSRGQACNEASALTLAGELDPAFNVLRWLCPGKTTLIFHHGTAERPFDTGRNARSAFHHMFGGVNLPAANVIVLPRALPRRNGAGVFGTRCDVWQTSWRWSRPR
jgi:hypothetical protein